MALGRAESRSPPPPHVLAGLGIRGNLREKLVASGGSGGTLALVVRRNLDPENALTFLPCRLPRNA